VTILPPLATASWRTVAALSRGHQHVGVPVRISVGKPKMIPISERFPLVRGLAPFGLLHLPPDQFNAAYVARLEAHVGSIVQDLNDIGLDYEGRTLPLCCFETDPTDCHRSIAAAWLEERFDAEVPEVSTMGPG
jgi:hypothetical protein